MKPINYDEEKSSKINTRKCYYSQYVYNTVLG